MVKGDAGYTSSFCGLPQRGGEFVGGENGSSDDPPSVWRLVLKGVSRAFLEKIEGRALIGWSEELLFFSVADEVNEAEYLMAREIFS